jgi:DNA primase
VAGCFADPDDWADIEEMMALREITWEEVLDIIAQVGKVWNDEEVPANRAAKRAVKKATRA